MLIGKLVRFVDSCIGVEDNSPFRGCYISAGDIGILLSNIYIPESNVALASVLIGDRVIEVPQGALEGLNEK
tara:strand:+ start:2609 stop:2824 length:216 start_codon:yes stop_codon:yes gene_type:complete